MNVCWKNLSVLGLLQCFGLLSCWDKVVVVVPRKLKLNRSWMLKQDNEQGRWSKSTTEHVFCFFSRKLTGHWTDASLEQSAGLSRLASWSLLSVSAQWFSVFGVQIQKWLYSNKLAFLLLNLSCRPCPHLTLPLGLRLYNVTHWFSVVDTNTHGCSHLHINKCKQTHSLILLLTKIQMSVWRLIVFAYLSPLNESDNQINLNIGLDNSFPK